MLQPINVFSWALSQPNEDTYDFAWLDEIIDRLYENGTYVCLASKYRGSSCMDGA